MAGVPPAETYSYVFDGNAQTLDHVLLSPEASAQLTAFDHARINADFPVVFRGDPARVERTSDHDPAIAYFAFPRDTTGPVVTVPASFEVVAQGPLGAMVTWTAIGHRRRGRAAAGDLHAAVRVRCWPTARRPWSARPAMRPATPARPASP